MNKNIKYFFNRFYDKMFDEDTLGNAAQVAFYFSFSLFPLLLFLISLFGLVLESADDFRLELFAYLRRIMPVTAYELVFHTMNEVIEKSSGGKITLGILIALWSSSAGLDALRGALNEVYRVKETRPYWKTKPLSLLLTLLIGLLVFVALGIVFYGSQFIVWLLATTYLTIPSPFLVGFLKWTTILAVLLFAFALVYNALPDRKIFRWQWITPGAIAGIALWLIASNGFRIYLGYFDSYSKTYGSLGAMIILMLWLYITALVILVGGVINQILEEVYDKMRLVSESQAIQTGHAQKAAEPDKSIVAAFVPKKTSSANKKTTADAEPAETVDTEKDNSAETTDKVSTETQSKETENLESPVAVKPEIASSTAFRENAIENTAEIPQKNDSISEDETEKVVAETDETVSAKSSNKPLVSLTVVGVFGLLMGLMFRKNLKNNNSQEFQKRGE